MSPFPQMNLQLVTASGCKVTAHQVAERRKEKKHTKFMLCLFSISWATFSDNSQGLEVCNKDKVHVQRFFLCRMFYKLLCIGKGRSGREVN